MSQSAFAAAMDKIVADCNDRLEWVRFSKDRLTKEAARVLIEQWSSFTRHSRQCWAFVVGNCPHVQVRKFIVTENLYEEEAMEGHSHFEILIRMGIALGLTREQIEFAQPLPSTIVALRAWETLTKNRTWYEGLAAKSVLERTNNPNCGNFSHYQAEHWMRQLNLSKEDAEFWWMHDSVDQIHGDGSLNLLEKYLKTDEEKQAALRAAEESMMALQIYFDGFYHEGLRRIAEQG
jgi:pyrroloquinoline quinone (PQQ) biosynthesis protein C